MNQGYRPINKVQLLSIKADDVVERMLAFAIPMYLRVTEVTKDKIICGTWEFGRSTGLEVDDLPSMVGYLRRVLTEQQKELVKSGAELDYP